MSQKSFILVSKIHYLYLVVFAFFLLIGGWIMSSAWSIWSGLGVYITLGIIGVIDKYRGYLSPLDPTPPGRSVLPFKKTGTGDSRDHG